MHTGGESMKFTGVFQTVRQSVFPLLSKPLLVSGALAVLACAVAARGFAAPPVPKQALAPTPPMGWNDWAHYQCGFTAQTILDNAKALVDRGLAAAGYDTVTIDDCWMQKTRDGQGNLRPDRQRFPHGMQPVANAIHGLGLKFGIYEDAGYATCGGFAGSGESHDSGRSHFLQDARLFASWGVDYLKLDGCNIYVPAGESKDAAYRKAYAAENAALRAVRRPIVFSESAPAYFQGTPEWYDVLTWVRGYGQLWREGSDIAIFQSGNPTRPRFSSVLWNYAYNLPLGRFQGPGNWNDADFVIGGDAGLTLAETRSQPALWSMMSAPLILSSDVAKLSPQAVAILSNHLVIGVDQDPMGKMSTLLRRSKNMDLLFKKLSGGDYAVAVFNRGTSPAEVDLRPADLGFAGTAACKVDAQDLWSGTEVHNAAALHAEVAARDTAIWRINAAAPCGIPTRSGTITMIAGGEHIGFDGYTQCLAAPGVLAGCASTPAETWTIGKDGELQSAGQCLTTAHGQLTMRSCAARTTQRWRYTQVGNLVDADGQCLTASSSRVPSPSPGLSLHSCGHNQPDQIWSLPN